MDLPRFARLRRQLCRLEGSVCGRCSRLHFPPRSTCPACGHDETSPRELSGRGTLYSHCEVANASATSADEGATVFGLIRLEDGLLLLAQLTDVDPADLHVDMPLDMVVRRLRVGGERGPIVYGYKFVPARLASSRSLP